MHRSRAATAALLLGVLVAPGPTPARAGTAGRTTDTWSLTPADFSVSVSDNGQGAVHYPEGGVHTEDTDPGVRLDGTRSGDHLSLRLLHPTSPDDTLGDWSVRLSGDLSQFTRPGLHHTRRVADPGDLTFDLSESGCGSTGPGRVDVLDTALDSRDRVSRMWLRYWFTCGSTGLMTGEVRWGYPEAEVGSAPTSVVFQDTQPQALSPAAAVMLHKPAGTSYQQPVVTGPDAGSFRIVRDRCADAPAEAPECSVSVAFAPSRAGVHTATLVMTDGGSTVRTPLQGRGLPGTFRTVVDSDPASIFGDRDGDVTPATATLRGFLVPRYTSQQAFVASYRSPDGQGYSLEFLTARDTTFGPGSYERLVAPATPSEGPGFHPSWWNGGSGLGCPTDADRGRWTVNQALGGPAPAYDVEFSHWCGDSAPGPTTRGHVWFGARSDVEGPAPVTDLRLGDGSTLSWLRPDDAVTSVVRARRGGEASAEWDTGELVYAGPAQQVTVPRALRGRSVAFDVFTLDDTGNVSAATTARARGGSRVGLRAGAATIAAGDPLVLRGTVTDAEWGYRLGSRGLVLEARRPGRAWRTLGEGTTASTGRYAFTVRPRSTRDYRVVAAGDRTHRGATSPVRRVRVS